MAERKITVTANPTKAQSVSVSPNSVQSYINATPDTSLYYSTISKKWAVEMGGLVNGEDYSAKHYAGQSAQSATEAQNFAEQAENSKDELLNDTGFIAVKDNLDSIITTAVNIEDINTNAENIEAIKNASAIALDKADRDLSNLTEEGQAKLNEKANKSLNNLDEQGKKHFLNKSQITNCLLEVPQNIKLELNDGKLILKAGSIVTVPNGFEADGVTPKFDYVTVERDLTISASSGGDTPCIIFYNAIGKNIYYEATSKVASGTTSINSGTYYHTDTNLIDTTNSQGGIKNSLPLCLCGRTSGVITSIDQVFNGRGCIGSTAWVDKGVRALIPNSFNKDGTYKNIEVQTTAIATTTVTEKSREVSIFLDSNGKISKWGSDNGNIRQYKTRPAVPERTYVKAYIEDENIWWYGDNTTTWVDKQYIVPLFKVYTDANAQILSADLKLPFRAVDYNDLPITSICKTKATTSSTATQTSPAVVVQNYVNGTSWYRVWSDGWIEQGGYITRGSASSGTVTLLKAFSNTNYTITMAGHSCTTYWQLNWHSKSTGSFAWGYTGGTGGSSAGGNWYACGY